MPDMIDRIARIICPEAWDRDEFRRIVKRTNGGHTTGIDVEASMKEARNAARQTARDVLAEIARPSPMEVASESVARLGLGDKDPSTKSRMEIAVALDRIDDRNGVKRG